MRKLLAIFFVCFFSASIAQKKNLVIEGVPPDLYISHKVTAGESFFSVGRKYNQTPQIIAAFNNLVLEKGLLLGQTLRVPLTSQNLSVSAKAEAGETLIPLHHVVVKNETLFRISNNANAALADVRQWNNLSSDNIAAGTLLVVGYLKTGNTLAASGKKSSELSGSTDTAVPTQETKVPHTEVMRDQPVVIASAERKEEIANNEQLKKEGSVLKVEVEPAPINKETATVTVAPRQNVPSQVVSQPTQTDAKTKKIDLLAPQPESSIEGVFSEYFSADDSHKSLANKTGEAATFKSTSGWQDKKYYALMDNVPSGTILKIASGDNKVVFVKVLGSMPEMKENKGLLLRISNAAASYLGMVDPKFPVQVSFYE